MMFFAIRWVWLSALISLLFSSPCLAQEKYLPYPGIIHIHSYVSRGGFYSPERLVGLAQEKGIKILIFSDTFLGRYEYGLPIFSNIFRLSQESPSIIKYGVRRYWEDFKKIKEEFPNMLILEGTEVAPFYWWSGSPFKKNLSLNDRNRQLLVTGLKKYQDYAHLPVTYNRYILPRLKDIPALFICLSSIILGIFFLKKKKQGRVLGAILNVAAILFLLHLFPFSASRYNPYFGEKNYLPYQDLINYVQKRGGLVFWSCPDISERIVGGRFATITYSTLTYPESLKETSGYTGFGLNLSPGAGHNLILAGSEWDKVLTDYCEGKRGHPVWVIGEADYRGAGPIDSVQNIFFLSEFKYDSLYEALRKGRLYIRYHSADKINISLNDFHIEDHGDLTGMSGFIADEIQIKGKPRLNIKGSYKISAPESLKIELIRNGNIIKEFEFAPSEKERAVGEDTLTGFGNEGVFDLEFQDDSLEAQRRKNYYRINFFVGGTIVLATNPIFVEIKS